MCHNLFVSSWVQPTSIVSADVVSFQATFYVYLLAYAVRIRSMLFTPPVVRPTSQIPLARVAQRIMPKRMSEQIVTFMERTQTCHTLCKPFLWTT